VCQEGSKIDHGKDTTVELYTVMTAYQTSVLNEVHENSLEEIIVVQEYPDVFPEELLGISPDCDIEFIIDLLPGTPLFLRGLGIDITTTFRSVGVYLDP
jgi:hypothetical protein